MLILPMAGVTPIIMTGNVSTQSRPPNVAGVWVTLMGRGGGGGTGTVNNNGATSGASGGGGGAYIPRVWIPVSALGSTFSLTIGSTSSRFARFVSGGITLSAGWGDNGGFYNAGSDGGVATATGFTDGVILNNGSNGGNGGLPGSKGQVGVSTTNGAGAGGGGGGGGGSGKGALGGTSSAPPGTDGAAGSNGSFAGGGQRGGNGGGGGGWTAASGQNPGAAYAELEWN
jgi:hypothetical protein